ncbi:hypothetical protein OG535_06905 [Kitasatospora sp. NBC_00085]|uniref:hypothetical protein n=1 Tax=unclassified Kitasatospora TaxID=2633591 RepID=UPI0032539640
MRRSAVTARTRARLAQLVARTAMVLAVAGAVTVAQPSQDTGQARSAQVSATVVAVATHDDPWV